MAMRGWLQRRLCRPWCIQFCSGAGQCWRRRHFLVSTHHPHSNTDGALRHWPQLERCASHLYSSAGKHTQQRASALVLGGWVGGGGAVCAQLPFMAAGLSMKKSPSQTMEKSTGRSPDSSPSYQYCGDGEQLRHAGGERGEGGQRRDGREMEGKVWKAALELPAIALS